MRKGRNFRGPFRGLLRGWLGWNRGTVCLVGMFLTLIAGTVIWCSATTFRAMSDWMLYAVNLLAALLLTLPALLSRRVWPQIVIMAVVDILWIANVMYCRTYFTAIPFDTYFLVGNLSDFTASVKDSIRIGDFVLPLITVATALVAYRLPKRREWPSRTGSLAAAVALGLTVWIGLVCRGGFYAAYDKLAQSCYYSTCGVPTYTVAGHLIYNSMNERNADPASAKRETARWLTEKEAERPFIALPDSVGRRRNLVIILLESFESWPVGKRVGEVEITPFINSLVSRPTTLYAPAMLTQVGAGRSIDAQLLLGSGMLPMLNSVYSMKYPQYDYPSLMKAMRENRGARSVILTCDKPITWNQEVIARAMGYDSLLHRSSWRHDELIGNPAKLSDGSFLTQSVEKLKSGELGIDGRPYLLTFVTYSGHNPFRLPDRLKDPALKAATQGFPERLADYILMARYTDSKLRTLIDYLQSRPDASETLIVITGDHEGLAGDRADLLETPQGSALVDPGKYTPFIALNSPVGGRVDGVIGQVDMYPTLLTLMGLESYRWKGMGQNILARPRVAAAISSMTGELAGDTTAATPAAMRNLREARRISDMMISNNIAP